MRYKLTVYDNDGSITYETKNADELIRQLESLKNSEAEEVIVDNEKYFEKHLTPYEHRRNEVYATGNRWAIENFKATH